MWDSFGYFFGMSTMSTSFVDLFGHFCPQLAAGLTAPPPAPSPPAPLPRLRPGTLGTLGTLGTVGTWARPAPSLPQHLPQHRLVEEAMLGMISSHDHIKISHQYHQFDHPKLMPNIGAVEAGSFDSYQVRFRL